MDYLFKVSKQTLWQITGKAVTSISTIILLGFVTRFFGKEGTGVYTQVLTYLSIFYLLADFGFNAYMLERVSVAGVRAQIEWRKFLGARVIWAFCLVLVALVTPLFLPFSTPEFYKAVLFGSWAIIFSAIFITVNLIFQSKLKYNLSIIASSIGTIFSLFFTLLILFLSQSLNGLLLGHTLGWMVFAIASLVLVRKYQSSLDPIFDLGFLKDLFLASWPIALTLTLNVIYFRLDSFMLAAFKTFADVGIYNLSYQIFQNILVIPTFIMNAFYPLMLEDFQKSNKLFKDNLIKACFIMLGLSLIVTATIFFLAPFIIYIIGGSLFTESVLPLRNLSLAFPAYFVSAVLMWTLVVLKRYKTMAAIYFVGLILNGLLNYLFIPQYSYLASSVITGACEYLILFLQIGILIGSWKRS